MRRTDAFDSDTFRHYARVAHRHPPLTREQEYDLARRSRAGEPRARRLLVHHNVAFVLSLSRRYMGKGVRIDDVIQEGMVGLLKGVEHFDPAKGNRFSTYASWWIRAYVQKYLRDQRASVKPTVTHPGAERIPLPRDFSLDTPLENGEDETFLDRLEDAGPLVDEIFERAEMNQDIHDLLARMRKRIGGLGMDIIEQRLMEGADRRTLEEIGKDWGLSRERVRQVEKSTRTFLERVLPDT